MSNQSILELDREVYLQKAEKNLLQMSDAYFFNKHFKIGEGVDEDKKDFYYQMYRLLCEENCEIQEFIKDKIEGKLEDCKIKPNSSTKLAEILYLAKQYLETQECSLDEAVSECCSWNSVAW